MATRQSTRRRARRSAPRAPAPVYPLGAWASRLETAYACAVTACLALAGQNVDQDAEIAHALRHAVCDTLNLLAEELRASAAKPKR